MEFNSNEILKFNKVNLIITFRILKWMRLHYNYFVERYKLSYQTNYLNHKLELLLFYVSCTAKRKNRTKSESKNLPNSAIQRVVNNINLNFYILSTHIFSKTFIFIFLS